MPAKFARTMSHTQQHISHHQPGCPFCRHIQNPSERLTVQDSTHVLYSTFPHFSKITGFDPKLISTTLMGLGLWAEKHGCRRSLQATGHSIPSVRLCQVGDGGVRGTLMWRGTVCVTCVHVALCTCVHAYVCVHACAGERLMPGIFLSHSPPYFLF